MKKIYTILCGLAISAVAHAQHYMWVVDEDNNRSKYDISTIDSITSSNTLFRIFFSDGTKKTIRYVDMDYISVKDLYREIYIPNELRNNNFNSESSNWCWSRSKESEHFIVFWEPGFGADPSMSPSSYKVDIDDLLEKAEHFFDVYTNQLGFVIPGSSNTDKYKIEIYLKYQTEWLATGSGYDDVIGALWVNPSTCKPVGHTIAHEIGHSFQYQTSCDQGLDHGFRYGYGDNASGGNAYWESCAQWQGFKVYPDQQFTDYRFPNYCKMTFYNPLHETPRYDFFFDQDYWCFLHGEDFIGKLWRLSNKPEDPIEAYKRLTGITQEKLNEEMYDRAARFATWDIPALRERGKNFIGLQVCNLHKNDEGAWQVDSAFCPQNYGYNIIKLNRPESGTTVKANFKGLAGAKGYRAIKTENAGWRYGFVALSEDGTRTYGEMKSDKEGFAELNIPENCTNLWFVVCGAPTSHWRHPWDDDASNDEQWPYQVSFENTNLFGEFEFDEDYVGHNETLTYNIDLKYDSYNHSYVNQPINDIDKVCSALGLSQKEIIDGLANQSIKFLGIGSDGNNTTTSTANGYGHWFDSTGRIVNYGGSSIIFSEFQTGSFSFNIGQYPAHATIGKTYTIQQGLSYTKNGKTNVVKFIFNVRIVS